MKTNANTLREKKCFSEQLKVLIHQAITAAYRPVSIATTVHHFSGFPGAVEMLFFHSNGVWFSVLTHFSSDTLIMKVFYGREPQEYYKVLGGEKWSVDNSRHSKPWILRYEHTNDKKKGEEVWIDTSIPLHHPRHEEMGSVIERIKRDIITIRRSAVVI